jgi:uncharacterized protein DUF6335
MKRRRATRRRRAKAGPAESGRITSMLREVVDHPEVGPRLTGGDIDADWTRAESSGEEAVGGSVATPDQDIVDELGRALGVEQELDAEVRTSEEILRTRDRMRWRLEEEKDKE